MQITTQQEFKTTVSGLRAELKNAGITQFSHTHVQEMLAKAMGASSWGELKTRLPKGAAKKNEVQKEESDKPRRCADDVDPLDPRPLDNGSGWLDIVPADADAMMVTGLFHEVSGTVEDIIGSIALATPTGRDANGNVEIQYDGETEVNWDGQTTRKGADGRPLWYDSDDYEEVNEVQCLVAPQYFDRREPEDALVREELVRIYERIVRTNPECGVQEVLDESTEDLEDRPILDWIAQHLRFRLHEGEAQLLYKRLKGN